MDSYYSGDQFAEDHIYTDITTCDIEKQSVIVCVWGGGGGSSDTSINTHDKPSEQLFLKKKTLHKQYIVQQDHTAKQIEETEIIIKWKKMIIGGLGCWWVLLVTFRCA